MKTRFPVGDFALELRKHRDSLGLTQEQAAARLGVKRPLYARWESGRVPPRPASLTRLSTLLGFNPYSSDQSAPLPAKDTEDIIPSSGLRPLHSPVPEDLYSKDEPIPHNEVSRAGVPKASFAIDDQSDPYGQGPSKARAFERVRRYVPRVKMAIGVITDATFWVPGYIQQDTDNDYLARPEYRERDEILIPRMGRMFNNMKHVHLPFRFAMMSFLLYAMTCGYSLAEKVWQCINGHWVLIALKVQKPWDFWPWVDDYGNLLGFYHYFTGKVYHPDRFLFGVWPYLHGNNWLGMSEIEPIRQEIETLNKKREQQNRMIEKQSMIPLQHTRSVDMPAAQKVASDQNAESLSSLDMWHTDGEIGEDGKLHAVEEITLAHPDAASAAMQVQLNASIMADANEITRVLGIPDSLGLSDTSVGSWAKARTEFDMFQAKPENASIWIANNVNQQLIRDFIRYNYPMWACDDQYARPKVAFQAIDLDYQLKEQQLLLADLEAGAITLDEYRLARNYTATPLIKTQVL